MKESKTTMKNILLGKKAEEFVDESKTTTKRN